MNTIKVKNQKKLTEIVDIGSCIKIENSNKIFQIIGINCKKSICWIREWPINYDCYKTFTLSINKIKVSAVCSNIRNKK